MAALLRAFRPSSRMGDGRFWSRFRAYWNQNSARNREIEDQDVDQYTEDVNTDEELEEEQEEEREEEEEEEEE